jgi:hypothetical protein
MPVPNLPPISTITYSPSKSSETRFTTRGQDWPQAQARPCVLRKDHVRGEEGARITPACREHGISPKTVFMRVGRDPEAARRFTQAKQVRLQKWHEEWLGEMHEHAKRSPWATAWLLERNFPELYALREFTRPVTNGSQSIGDKVSEDQLRKYAELMEHFRQENGAKTPSLTAPGTAGKQVA